jgi:hypothetical protein
VLANSNQNSSGVTTPWLCDPCRPRKASAGARQPTMLSVVLVVVVVIVVVVVVAIVDVVVLVVTVVVVSHERVSWSSTPSHSPLTLQHAK